MLWHSAAANFGLMQVRLSPSLLAAKAVPYAVIALPSVSSASLRQKYCLSAHHTEREYCFRMRSMDLFGIQAPRILLIVGSRIVRAMLILGHVACSVGAF
jgi:hypothetical protein